MLEEAAWRGSVYLRDLLNHVCYEREVHQTKAGQRRLRLFGCASCRAIMEHIPPGPCRRAVEVAEAYAEGRAKKEDMEAARAACNPFLSRAGAGPAEINATQAAYRAASPEALRAGWAGVEASSALHGGWVKDDGVFCVLLRDIFGNPFRPASVERSWLTANDGAAAAIARAIHDDQAFGRLPILADALQDAGCSDEAILGHCRGPGPHARGCWVVDLLLGKGRNAGGRVGYGR